VTSSWWHLARGRGARWGVVALWVLGAILSYSALRDLAVMLGFPEALGDLFPLVIDVAVWVGSMNALEAREHGRRVVERYAWGLVGLYSSATVAGNALVASTEAVDPRCWRSRIVHRSDHEKCTGPESGQRTLTPPSFSFCWAA
jgi:hypothetical protein